MEQPNVPKIDLQNLDNVENIVDNVEEKPRELNDLEQRMQSHGWNPSGELSALDWIDSGFKIKNKKLDSAIDKLERMAQKQEQIEKDAYAKARADLEARRISAIEEADLDTVKDIEKQQHEMVDPSVREYADAFVDRNRTWLTGTEWRDKEMAAICSVKDRDLLDKKLPPKEHFEQLEAFVREKFPDYFGIEKPISASVEGRQQATPKHVEKTKLTYNDLDEFQKRAAKRYAKDFGKSTQDYINKLQELSK